MTIKLHVNDNITSLVKCPLLKHSILMAMQIAQRVTSHCIITFEKASFI